MGAPAFQNMYSRACENTFFNIEYAKIGGTTGWQPHIYIYIYIYTYTYTYIYIYIYTYIRSKGGVLARSCAARPRRSRKSRRGAARRVLDPPSPESGSRRCALIGVPCRLRMLSVFGMFDDMLRLTISPQATRAETDPRQGTPTRAHFQRPDQRGGIRKGGPRPRSRGTFFSDPRVWIPLWGALIDVSDIYFQSNLKGRFPSAVSPMHWKAIQHP